MHGLKILNLSKTDIQNLPYSIIASRVDKKLKVDWNASISDYHINGHWNIPTILHQDIANDIKKVEIKSGHIDKLIWKKNVLGEITAKSAFHSLIEYAPTTSWGKWIWETFIPPRKSLLIWKIIHNALPTLDNIQLRGIPIVSACPLCFQSSENADHIFTRCSLAKQIWMHFLPLLNLNIDLHESLFNIMEQIRKLKVSHSLYSITKVLFMSIIWSVWEARNKLIFEGIRPYFNGLISSIWNSIHDLKFFKLRGFYGNQNELQIANVFKLPFLIKKMMRIKEVYWALPHPGWIKVNVDGSAKGAPGEIFSAGVFRTCRGFVKGCFVANMGIGLALEAEIWAVIIAIEVAFMNGWRCLWIESDSLLVVELLKKKSKTIPWRIIPRWLHCLHMMNNMVVGISHIYREGNQAADHLTSIVTPSFQWWNGCPNFLWPFICKDLQQRPYFRFY